MPVTLDETLQQIMSTRDAAIAMIKQANSLDEVESLRLRFLSKKGEVSQLTKSIGDASSEDRPAVGAGVNDAKKTVADAIDAQRLKLEAGGAKNNRPASAIDVTLPGTRRPIGRRHPLSLTIEDIKSILIGLGFSYDDYPEVETEFHVFDSLNMPTWHPAREMQDSFFTESGHVLRTHTTSFQMHAMRDTKPPLRAFTVGRNFRRDEIDATHFPMFHQVDAIALDKSISFSDLKWTLFEMLKQLLGNDIKLRFRPSYFPFTTPSAECDVFYRGRWMELLGGGMIHPGVLRNGGLDPNVCQGWAFGMGIERIAMARFAIDDIRLLFENDETFLSQF